MGTPDFAVAPLRALANSKHTLCSVYTRPPKPAGRGMKMQKSPVHEFAESANIPVLTPKSLRQESEQNLFKSFEPDLALVAAYGLLLPKEILEAPKLGCINIHASLLPKWRGAAPVQRAIEAGDKISGITYMQMDEGLDKGAILEKHETEIGPQTTAQSLLLAFEDLSKTTILPFLEGLESKDIKPSSQDEINASYAKKLSRSDAEISWKNSAYTLKCQLNAFTPWPGQYFKVSDKIIKVLKGEVLPFSLGETPAPGTVSLCKKTLKIATTNGWYNLLVVQPIGKKEQEIQAFLNGQHLLSDGDILTS